MNRRDDARHQIRRKRRGDLAEIGRRRALVIGRSRFGGMLPASHADRMAVDRGEWERIDVAAAEFVHRRVDSERSVEIGAKDRRCFGEAATMRKGDDDERQQEHGDRHHPGPDRQRWRDQHRKGECKRQHSDHEIGPKTQAHSHHGAGEQRPRTDAAPVGRTENDDAHDQNDREQERPLGVIAHLRHLHEIRRRCHAREQRNERNGARHRQPQHAIRERRHGSEQ